MKREFSDKDTFREFINSRPAVTKTCCSERREMKPEEKPEIQKRRKFNSNGK